MSDINGDKIRFRIIKNGAITIREEGKGTPEVIKVKKARIEIEIIEEEKCYSERNR